MYYDKQTFLNPTINCNCFLVPVKLIPYYRTKTQQNFNSCKQVLQLKKGSYFFSHHLQKNLKHLVANSNNTLHHT